MRRRDGEEGFTLVEIVISLAILALLMLPALNSYVTAAKVNQQAQLNQKAATLGQNIAENLKAMSLEEILLEFNSASCFQVINSNLNGSTATYVMHSYMDFGYGEYVPYVGGYLPVVPGDGSSSIAVIGSPPVYSFEPPAGRTCYYLGINDIKDGTAGFDVLVTLDAAAYRDTLSYPDSMNNYRMPQLNDPKQKGVTLLDIEGSTTTWSDPSPGATYDNSNSVDHQALEYFKNIHSSYLIYEQSMLEEGTTPTMTPVTAYTEQEIHDAIAKEIQVFMSKDSIRELLQIECIIKYDCSLDLNGDGATESTTIHLYDDRCSLTEGSEYDRLVYLFYTPTDFLQADTISLSNQGANIKMMLAKQEGSVVSDLLINKSDTDSGTTKVYTNLSAGNIAAASLGNITEYNLITKAMPKDRIFDVTVEVLASGSLTANDLSEPYAVFRATKENE